MFAKNTTLVIAIATALILIGSASIMALQYQAFGQGKENENETGEMSNMSNVTAGPTGTLPSMSTPGEKTFYIFTAEVENVDEQKLKVAGDSFSVHTLVVNKGDKVKIHFFNVDDVKTERHSFTIGDPYKVDIDVGFAGKGDATFTADHTGVFTYYCKYHLPVMSGQLVVLP